ncbi:MAG: TetR/AcrR family transcriptional regulator [Leptolyngbya sp. SIOISBB]|nr:TetR/AcrR family transcriptional regulator [Leptolyngbya sp. SIOISBB]
MAKSSREKIIRSALTLFLSQGVSQTTTRQIADLAGVNEVTLFRNFGNKYGLLQAVIQSAPTFRTLGEALMAQTIATGDRHQALKTYASECLSALEQAPAFVRSLIGESDQFPTENRQALGQRIEEASRYVAQYLEQTMPTSLFSSERLSGYLGALLVGYIVIESTCDEHHLWASREDFLEGLVIVLLGSTTVSGDSMHYAVADSPLLVQDLPAPVVHQILSQAKAAGTQDHALAYLLFGAGVAPAEIVGVTRAHHLSAKTQHTLHVGDRQVSINQWIWGKRYGSYTSNPLTKWLKSRKDESPWLFIQESADLIALDVDVIEQKWTAWTQNLALYPTTHADQAKQTWCVEMLTRGMSVDNLSILSGVTPEQLAPYLQRAREKAALEQARLLDQKQT